MDISRNDQVGGAAKIMASQAQRVGRQEVGNPEAFGTKVQETATRAGGSDVVSTVHPRLADFASKIDKRFQDAIGAKELSPRQQAALAKAQDHFHSMIARLDDASHNRGGTESTPKEGLNKILDLFTASVGNILSGGGADQAQTETTSKTRARAQQVPAPVVDTTKTRGSIIDTVG
jgi:hypothetical protein